MIELLRNCSHGSETALYRIYQASPKIRKAASTSAGLAELHREQEGWEWYRNRRYSLGRSLPYAKTEMPSYVRIERDWLEGTKGDYTKGIVPNAEFLRLAVGHYLTTWPRQKNNVPIHGDFSIDNILLNAEGVHVIDWEDFDIRGGPWGFDALYLLFETLWFSVKNNRPIRIAESDVIKPIMKQLKSSGFLCEAFDRQALSAVCELLKTRLSSSRVPLFENKFPPLRFSCAQTAMIDRAIYQMLEKDA